MYNRLHANTSTTFTRFLEWGLFLKYSLGPQLIIAFTIKRNILVPKKQQKSFCGQEDRFQPSCKLIGEYSNENITWTCSAASMLWASNSIRRKYFLCVRYSCFWCKNHQQEEGCWYWTHKCSKSSTYPASQSANPFSTGLWLIKWQSACSRWEWAYEMS